MALGNLLKKAAELKDVAKKELEKGKELLKTVASDSQKKEEPVMVVTDDQLKKNRHCTKGECYHLGTALFCFGCDSQASCSTKEFFGGHIYSTDDPSMLPIIKKIAEADYLQFHGMYKKDFQRAKQLLKEAAAEYIEECLPSFKGHESIFEEYFHDKEFAGKGMGKLLDELNQFDISEFSDIEEKLYIINYYGVGSGVGRHYAYFSPESDWLVDASLFRRDLVDFEFTLVLAATVQDSWALKDFYKDCSGIELKCLYNENGEFKPVGSIEMGKDSLLGLIESWKTTADGEDNTADKDFAKLYYQMKNHELPTVREINQNTWEAVTKKLNEEEREEKEKRQLEEKKEREMENEKRRQEDAIRREQQRQAAEELSQEARAHRKALHRCSKCRKRFACGSRGIPNCGAFDPE